MTRQAVYVDPKAFTSVAQEKANGDKVRYWTTSIIGENLALPSCPDQIDVDVDKCSEEYEKPILYTFAKGSVKVYKSGSDYIPKKDFYEDYSEPGKYTYNCWSGRRVTISEDDFITVDKITMKWISFSEDDYTYIDVESGEVARLVFNQMLNLNYDIYDFKTSAAYIKMTEDVYKKKIAAVVHKDRYGVQIELGDVVMYQNQTWMVPFIVTSIEPETVNNKSPRKLIVIRTNNPNKKLTWGL
jgi:hypothetical protein